MQEQTLVPLYSGASGSKEKGAASSSGKMVGRSHGGHGTGIKDNEGNDTRAGQCRGYAENQDLFSLENSLWKPAWEDSPFKSAAASMTLVQDLIFYSVGYVSGKGTEQGFQVGLCRQNLGWSPFPTSGAQPSRPCCSPAVPTAHVLLSCPFLLPSGHLLKEQNLVKELRPRDLLESSSDSDEKVPVAKPSSLSKRKLELEVETVEKKKKGRPRKDSRLMPVSLSVQQAHAVSPSPARELSAGICTCPSRIREAVHATVCLISVETVGRNMQTPTPALSLLRVLEQFPGVSYSSG
ncbi:hypothetical protein GH733_018215, partial [Mirounga leonina]